jgi:hypothetical protein
VILIVVVIKDGGDPPRDLAVPQGQKKLHLRVLKKRVLLSVELFLEVSDQRGNPVGIAPVDIPGKKDEFFEVFLGFDLHDADRTHPLISLEIFSIVSDNGFFFINNLSPVFELVSGRILWY